MAVIKPMGMFAFLLLAGVGTWASTVSAQGFGEGLTEPRVLPPSTSRRRGASRRRNEAAPWSSCRTMSANS